MLQRLLNFTQRQPLVKYSIADANFLTITPRERLPESFLIMSRAQRLGITEDELRCMKSWELPLELADELAILGLSDHQFIRPVRLDQDLIVAIAKRESLERAADFAEYLKTKGKQT